MLKLGVIGTSTKADERRLPLHPDHLSRLPEELRRQLVFEHCDGEPFGISDADLGSLAGGTASRGELLATLCTATGPDPGGDRAKADPHRVRGHVRLGPDGQVGRHTFYKNNELAGYCGVLVREEVLGCHYVRLRRGNQGEPGLIVVEHDGSERPFLDLLGEADIIVNGIFQDPDESVMFVDAEDVPRLKRDGLIVDVSCDEGMGFSLAKPNGRYRHEPLVAVQRRATRLLLEARDQSVVRKYPHRDAGKNRGGRSPDWDSRLLHCEKGGKPEDE